MAYKTIGQLAAATDVQSGDLLPLWKGSGPTYAVSVSTFTSYLFGLPTITGKVNRLGDTFTGPVGAPQLTVTGLSTLEAVTGTTGAFTDVVTGVTSGRQATGTAFSTVDHTLAVGQRFAPQNVYSAAVALTADDCGRTATLIGGPYTVTAPQLSTVRAGDTLTVENFDGASTQTLSAYGSNAFNAPGLPSRSSLRLPPGWRFIGWSDGGNNWNVTHYGPVRGGGALRVINSTSITAGSLQVDTTWDSPAFDRVLLSVFLGTNTSGTSPQIALRRADGTWSPNRPFALYGATLGLFSAELAGAQLDRGFLSISSAASYDGDPDILVGSSGTLGAQTHHTGGVTGIRLATSSSSSPLPAGALVVAAG